MTEMMFLKLLILIREGHHQVVLFATAGIF